MPLLLFIGLLPNKHGEGAHVFITNNSKNKKTLHTSSQTGAFFVCGKGKMSKLKESGVSVADIRAAQDAGVTLNEIRQLVADEGTDALGLAAAILEFGRQSRQASAASPEQEEKEPDLIFGA
ncbi:MAG: hypothetical protein GW946_02960 [Candidatus Pacebacteria bacterium]|nr:hypothetical protein [Candidatus Paceibacterota bacterium]PIR60327.1 MAG: hypothetical protein COU67_02535 [Candidatus Pacebacteria bacterium CG10_big_fil_rev_8_21_14_0_10_44_54]